MNLPRKASARSRDDDAVLDPGFFQGGKIADDAVACVLRRPMISLALSWASSSPMPLSRRKRAISPSAVLFRSILPAAAWALLALAHGCRLADLAGHDLVFLDVLHFLAALRGSASSARPGS
ncbi:MAG: hypothetical protein MZU91_01005 [Desulfosudis oleivorans]|nr:hypothetical protein [Desulfosudis oleivorans]